MYHIFSVYQCHDAHFALFGKTRLLITCKQQQQQRTIKNSRYIKNEFLPCFYTPPVPPPSFAQPILPPPLFFSLCILLLMGSICFSIRFFSTFFLWLYICYKQTFFGQDQTLKDSRGRNTIWNRVWAEFNIAI